ncbi:flagellar basal body P-ring formation chaperone FlgA [Pseudoduganella sp. GCM10020061]|uniref:flagellar basal body P-ring formation chaperone FlgA n=1 Tax=Pseudoduganella sp. GCM10020061 TaxID=3317345 RepID=UPI00362BA8EE
MKLTKIVSTLLLLVPLLALAQAPARQDAAALRAAAEQYLQQQSAGLPGKVTVTVGAVDPRLALAACPAPQAFQAPGARAWGKTTVGVKCTAPAWTVYLQAQVSVVSGYIASSVPLAQGQPVEAAQLVTLQGDIAALPNGVATDMAQVVGKMPTVSLPAGAPLRLDNLKARPVVQQGQTVQVVTAGQGFRVSAEARALGTAGEGQVVQVRTPNGAIISGVARAGGLVEVAL